MKPQDRISQWQLHPFIRGQFSFELYKAMAENEDIVLIVGDLGFGIFEPHKEDFKERYYNVGASEQAMMGIAVGMALEGKIPVVYSITPFLIFRAMETIRNYLNHENIAVKLIGSGMDKDYKHDGWSHDATDIPLTLELFPNIVSYVPKMIQQVPDMVKTMLENKRPSFMGLRR